MKKLMVPVGLAGILLLMVAWGSGGHMRINTSATLSFNQAMAQFQSWGSGLGSHASDADDRKATDPNESVRHYIDIDNYPQFLSSGRIPETLDSAIALYGSSFVYDQGVLPWATLGAYDSLKACFARQDWDKALLFASDLGHYVADGHMPLHICANYNGQLTGNDGIHSRYESTMVNNYLSQLVYEGDSIGVVSDIRHYIFKYLYDNYPFADSVIAADNYATAISSSYSSQAYRQALWQYSANFTREMFRNASRALAELLYNAWLESGSPSMTPSHLSQATDSQGFLIESSYPNPFSDGSLIVYHLATSQPVELKVLDVFGNVVDTLTDSTLPPGVHSVLWNPRDLADGIYFIRLQAGPHISLKRLIHQK